MTKPATNIHVAFVDQEVEMLDIRIDQVGRIVKGEGVGRYIKIIDDFKSTGGFLILDDEDQSMSQCFDSWVENSTDLKQFFEESGWEIEWIAEGL
ncbi:hypothetical protein [Azospirillum palustre]|uniref:hypothetical protein n=1 Tax=Azospirillum palustre TaxID=2044885 RepID=UPI00117861BE|nr:hypothetical protein [Azospirillum palustre]